MEDKETVLLILPDSLLRSQIASALKQAGFSVAEAQSGMEALVLSEKYHPVTALVDARLYHIEPCETTTRPVETGTVPCDQKTLQSLFDAIPGVLVVCDQTGRVTMTNGLGDKIMIQEFGTWIDAFNSKGLVTVTRPDGTVCSADDSPIVRSILKGEVVWGERMVLGLPSGASKTVIVNSAPICTEGGSVVGGVMIIQDMSDLQQAFAELEQDRNREHQVAERLVTAFIPTDLLKLERFETAGKYVFADEIARVGGDLYDIFALPDGSTGVVIADVSGRGLSAAMYTAMTKYVLYGYAIEDPSPVTVMERLNRALCTTMPPDFFVTLFYGVLDSDTNELVYANAGHEQPVIIPASERNPVTLDVTGRALGLVPDSRFSSRVVRLEPGDTLIVYTDGLTEFNTRDGLLGAEGLLKLFRKIQARTAQELVEELWEALRRLGAEPGKIRDDIAILCLKAL